MRKLVSIVIPCYNAEKWLAEAIDSCIRQTYGKVEIIVIDDGSTDSSLQIARNYSGRIILQEIAHQGGSAARNCGFKLSQGDYIQFLDADDYLLPEKIERQVHFLEETGIDVVYGDWRHQFHGNNGNVELGSTQICGEPIDILEALLSGWWTANMTLLFRKEIVAQSGGWDESLQIGQDRDFFISVAMTGAHIRYQPGCYSIYRRYGNVTVSTSNQKHWLESHEQVLKKSESILAAKGKLTVKRRQALAKSYFNLARNYYDIDRHSYQKLLSKAHNLADNFSGNQSATYSIIASFLGYPVADWVASKKRKIINR